VTANALAYQSTQPYGFKAQLGTVLKNNFFHSKITSKWDFYQEEQIFKISFYKTKCTDIESKIKIIPFTDF
jgi:hypothetical protein